MAGAGLPGMFIGGYIASISNSPVSRRTQTYRENDYLNVWYVPSPLHAIWRPQPSIDLMPPDGSFPVDIGARPYACIDFVLQHVDHFLVGELQVAAAAVVHGLISSARCRSAKTRTHVIKLRYGQTSPICVDRASFWSHQAIGVPLRRSSLQRQRNRPFVPMSGLEKQRRSVKAEGSC